MPDILQTLQNMTPFFIIYGIIGVLFASYIIYQALKDPENLAVISDRHKYTGFQKIGYTIAIYIVIVISWIIYCISWAYHIIYAITNYIISKYNTHR